MWNKINLGWKKTSKEKTANLVESGRLTEHGEMIGIEKVLKLTERQNVKLKTEEWNLLKL